MKRSMSGGSGARSRAPSSGEGSFGAGAGASGSRAPSDADATRAHHLEVDPASLEPWSAEDPETFDPDAFAATHYGDASEKRVRHLDGVLGALRDRAESEMRADVLANRGAFVRVSRTIARLRSRVDELGDLVAVSRDAVEALVADAETPEEDPEEAGPLGDGSRRTTTASFEGAEERRRAGEAREIRLELDAALAERDAARALDLIARGDRLLAAARASEAARRERRRMEDARRGRENNVHAKNPSAEEDATSQRPPAAPERLGARTPERGAEEEHPLIRAIRAREAEMRARRFGRERAGEGEGEGSAERDARGESRTRANPEGPGASPSPSPSPNPRAGPSEHAPAPRADTLDAPSPEASDSESDASSESSRLVRSLAAALAFARGAVRDQLAATAGDAREPPRRRLASAMGAARLGGSRADALDALRGARWREGIEGAPALDAGAGGFGYGRALDACEAAFGAARALASDEKTLIRTLSREREQAAVGEEKNRGANDADATRGVNDADATGAPPRAADDTSHGRIVSAAEGSAGVIPGMSPVGPPPPPTRDPTAREEGPSGPSSSDPAAPAAGDFLLGTAGAVRRGGARSFSPTGSVAAWTLAAVDRVAEVFASRALRDPRDPSSPPSMRETCACVALALAHLDALEEDLDEALFIEEEEDSEGGEGKADGAAAVNDADDAEDEEGSSATRASARASRKSSNVLASRFASREGVREAVRGAVDAATERYLAGDLGGSSGEWLDASGAYVESGGGLEELRALCRAGIVDDDDE